MFTDNDKEHIKLLYDNFLKINQYIKTAIENEDLETINNIFSQKNKLIKEIVSFEKIHQKDILNDEELVLFKRDLIKKEKENIELLESLKNTAVAKYSKLNKAKKLYNAYEPSLSETHSTLDIKEEDD